MLEDTPIPIKPIALIGLPGSGKSTVGRQLARRRQLALYDSDSVIEEEQGCSIRELFEKLGEASFRELEAVTIDKLTCFNNCIISTGGGSVLHPVSHQHLKSRCHCIYLRSTPEDLFRRLRNDRKRPLLQVADPLGALKRLFYDRDPLYSAMAAHVVETGRPSVTSLVNTISMQLDMLGLSRHQANGDLA